MKPVMNEASDTHAELASRGYSTPERSLDGWTGNVRVVDIYDGDTVQVVLNDQGRYIRIKCRLSGIDTCEIRSKRAANKRLAYAARNRLAALITGGSSATFEDASRRTVRAHLENQPAILRAKCGRADKYGRVLIKLFAETDGVSVGVTLIQERLAYRYHGGKKMSESEQIRELGHDDGAAETHKGGAGSDDQ